MRWGGGVGWDWAGSMTHAFVRRYGVNATMSSYTTKLTSLIDPRKRASNLHYIMYAGVCTPAGDLAVFCH